VPSGWRLGTPKTAFWGRVGDGSFSISPVVKGQDSFVPVLRGNIFPHDGGSRVQIVARPPLLIIALVLFVAADVVTTVVRTGTGGAIIVAALFCVFYVYGWCYMFWRNLHVTVARLASLLESG